MAENDLAETSADFDNEGLAPFLSRVSSLADGGFTEADAADLARAIMALEHDDQRDWRYTVRHRGRDVPLLFRAFMDDLKSPSIYVWSAPSLIAGVEAAIIALTEGPDEEAAPTNRAAAERTVPVDGTRAGRRPESTLAENRTPNRGQPTIHAHVVVPRDDVRPSVAALLGLPGDLRPTRHKRGETEMGQLIEDSADFIAGLHPEARPWLAGARCSYDIGLDSPTTLVCRAYLRIPPEQIQQFLVAMAVVKPIFAFACDPNELDSRNRVFVQLDSGSVEAWVGQDLERYVPGLYWLTLLSKELAEQHAVPVSEVAKVAQEAIPLDSGGVLFRFYDRPDDWEGTNAVSNLCATLPGMFSIDAAKQRLPGGRSYWEVEEVLQAYR